MLIPRPVAYGLLLSCFAVFCADARPRNNGQLVQLKIEVEKPCVSLANAEVAVLLPEALVRRVADGNDPLQKDAHTSQVWSERARKILAQTGDGLDRFGCRTMTLSSDDTTYLVAELIKRGDAAVYTSKSRELQATATFNETSCETAPAGYIDIIAEDGTPVVRMITCQV